MYYTFQDEGGTQCSVIGATEKMMTCGARRLYIVSTKHAGFHSTKQLGFLICTLNICSSTSLICLAPGCTAEQIMWGSRRGVGWRTLSHVQSWVVTCGMVSALHYGEALHATEQRLCTGGRGGCCRLRCLETSAQLYRTS